jgi:hypothetical protein
MKSGEKLAPEQDGVTQSAPFRVPASVEEAYELGWQWKRESFANLMTFGHTIEGVTRREGLAHFEGSQGELVIPFVATYAFGEPRVPKYPYAGGSVCLIDDDEEHAATLERKASRSTGKATVQEKRPDSPKTTSPEKDADKEKLWRVRQLMRGRVIHSYTCPFPMTEEDAVSDAFEAYTDELHLDVSEVKIKAPSARRRTKKTKTRR